MKVALVSTFPPAECGIGNYTRELVNALAHVAPDIEVVVIAERTERGEDGDRIVRAWHRRGDWAKDIAAAVERIQPDVVHVQHEESIFGNRPLPGFLRGLGRGTAVTLHTVYDGRRFGVFHKELASVSDRLVAHQRTGMGDVLEAQGVARDRIEVIAHGTPTLTLPAQRAARDQLGLPQDVPIALFFGFIHFRKRLHVALRAFERARVTDARFVIAGRMRMSHLFDRLYATWLRRQMRAGIDAGRIVYRPGFVPSDLKVAYFAAADLIVLPHDQPYGSASGVLHEAIATGRAILCTRGKKFAEAVEAFASQTPEMFPPAGDLDAWRSGFEQLLLDAQRRQRASQLVATLAADTSWTVSAERHARMYRAIAATRVAGP